MSQQRNETDLVSRLGNFLETAIEKIGWAFRLAHRRNMVITNHKNQRVFSLSLAYTSIIVFVSMLFFRPIFILLVVAVVAALFFQWRFHIERKTS